jgi:hypothetical protein
MADDLTDEQKAALAAQEAERKKAVRQEAKDLMKEALSEFAAENKPKLRTNPPAKKGIMATLFGEY